MSAAEGRVAAARTAVRDREADLSAARAELTGALDAVQQEAVAAGEAFTCPRRVEDGRAARDQTQDRYVTEADGASGQTRRCSYCGSMAADEFMDGVRSGELEVGPTDKNYKAYVAPADGSRPQTGKFYYQHLDEQQRDEFIQLHNQRTIKWGSPGYPYVPPYFAKSVATA